MSTSGFAGVTVLYGEDVVASRNALDGLRQQIKDFEIREISGKTADLSIVKQVFESSSLFSQPVCVIAESVLTAPKSSKIPKKLFFSLLETRQENVHVLCWEPSELTKDTLSGFPKGTAVSHFPLPKILFSFLDEIRPGAASKSLTVFKKLLEQEPAELVLSLLSTRVRQLIQIKDTATPAKANPWQVSRLTSQARLFTMDKLLSMHEKLFAIDLSNKSGTNPLPLANQLEQFVMYSCNV